MSQKIIFNTTSISLDWNDVSGANLYHCQVASDPDFVTIQDEDDALASSAFSFTDPGTDDTKRWWRWRYSTDSGSTWSGWSDVGMYWLDTDALSEPTVAVNKIALFSIDDLTDTYVFETFPELVISPALIERGRIRNRRGELLSDYITSKDEISMNFDDAKIIQREQYRQILRFHIQHKTFYLAINLDNGMDEIGMIWKVQLTEAPEFKPAALARNDLFEGELKFEEV